MIDDNLLLCCKLCAPKPVNTHFIEDPANGFGTLAGLQQYKLSISVKLYSDPSTQWHLPPLTHLQ